MLILHNIQKQTQQQPNKTQRLTFRSYPLRYAETKPSTPKCFRLFIYLFLSIIYFRKREIKDGGRLQSIQSDCFKKEKEKKVSHRIIFMM